MATLTRTNSGVNPTYKEYVNFLGGYKNGKKNENLNGDHNEHVKNFPLSTSSSNTSSSSLSSTDVTDFAKGSCISYNTFLENRKNRKFSSVKPKLEEKNEAKPNQEEKITKKSEIFIDIQPPAKSVSEVSKIFENRKPPARNNSINSKISIFEKQISTENKPKISEKPILPQKIAFPPVKSEDSGVPPQPKITTPPPKPVQDNGFALPPPPPPMPSEKPATNGSLPPSLNTKITQNGNSPPPPPPPVINNASHPATLQATLKKGPQTRYSVNNPNGALPNGIDRNDPLVRKLVYGTLRGLYGAYHDQASGMLATLPRNMVVKSNGVQDRIEQIAANGGLDKLNGRVNPKLEQE